MPGYTNSTNLKIKDIVYATMGQNVMQNGFDLT